ncbi:ead/Ea22-like family protein [Escherichia coli]|uniref:ead/Ea22-like family protein n=1 Tax=Escherichia coli TaxID=562 RepID=UPI003D652591
MSKIDYQALRGAAEAIKIAATPQKLLAFRMKVTPQVMLELLDEREAQSKRIAELEANFATLAVENVGLNKFIKDDCFIYTSDDISPRDANGFKPETPATDAFLADIQAVAFNELRAAFVRHAKVAELDDADTVTLKEVTEALLHCAEQIRAPE